MKIKHHSKLFGAFSLILLLLITIIAGCRHSEIEENPRNFIQVPNTDKIEGVMGFCDRSLDTLSKNDSVYVYRVIMLAGSYLAEVTSDSTITRPVAILNVNVVQKASTGLQTGIYYLQDTILPGKIMSSYCLYLPKGLNDTTGHKYYKLNQGVIDVENDAEMYTLHFSGAQTDSFAVDNVINAYYYGVLLKMKSQYL